jgi:hypothetical protein
MASAAARRDGGGGGVDFGMPVGLKMCQEEQG